MLHVLFPVFAFDFSSFFFGHLELIGFFTLWPDPVLCQTAILPNYVCFRFCKAKLFFHFYELLIIFLFHQLSLFIRADILFAATLIPLYLASKADLHRASRVLFTLNTEVEVPCLEFFLIGHDFYLYRAFITHFWLFLRRVTFFKRAMDCVGGLFLRPEKRDG